MSKTCGMGGIMHEGIIEGRGVIHEEGIMEWRLMHETILEGRVVCMRKELWQIHRSRMVLWTGGVIHEEGITEWQTDA